MGSCNQCIQRQEPLLIVPVLINTKEQINNMMATKIQSAFRAFHFRQKVKKRLAEKRPTNPKKSNSTDDCQIENRTHSYSPKIESLMNDENIIVSFEDKTKQKSLSHFGRKYSAKLAPKQLDSQEEEEQIQQGSQENISPGIKAMKSSQSKKIQSFRFRCVLTNETLEPKDKLKIESTNRRIKLDTIKLIGGNTYNGEWLNKLPDGKGKYIFSDTSLYIGEFSRGQLHGKGEFRNKDGAFYKGDWQNNRMQGYGIYCFVNGCKYEGQMERDSPNGQGIMQYSDGAIYTGTFCNGEKKGKGKLIFSNGHIYEGQFDSDDLNGQGCYRWQDGKVYEGQWLYGKMNGKGQLLWPDGRSYIGEYYNDKKNGYGIFNFSDGKKYIGMWKNGLQHGEGQFYKEVNGESIKGIWKNGQLKKLL